jgi:hypothetical protein
MKIIALGSYALGSYYRLRRPKDLDVVIHFDDLQEFKDKYELISLIPKSITKFHGVDLKGFNYEIEVAGVDEESSTDLLYNVDYDYKVDEKGISIPPISLLYMIKLCHKYKFSPHFEKTRNDILFLQGLVTERPSEHFDEFLKVRKLEANKKTPNLKVSKDEFFLDTYGDVNQIIHDTIHLTQALQDEPAYEKFNVGQVECSMPKFFELDEQIRLNAVFEESATLAVERALWPNWANAITDKKEYKAFKGSLQRLCCHISSGKFRTYAWNNYDNVLAMYKKGDIVRRFDEGLKDGTIKFHDEQFNKPEEEVLTTA